MDTIFYEPPNRPKKTAHQQLQEQIERQMSPLRQIQEMSDLVNPFPSDHQLKALTQQLEPFRQAQEMLERFKVPNHFREIIDRSSIAEQARHLLEQLVPQDLFANLIQFHDTPQQRVAGLDSIIDFAKDREPHTKWFSGQREMLEKLRFQASSGLSIVDSVQANPAFRAMVEAKKSLDSLWPMFNDIDLSQFEASKEDEQEIHEAAESIVQSIADLRSLQDAIEHISLTIQAQQNPKVQLILWMFFRKIVDWLIAGAIGAVMGYYSPAVLGESPQAAKKAVQEHARTAVGTLELLLEYRFVSSNVLIVRQNPRASSPEIGRLPLGKTVKLLKKEKSFALVLWTDKESGAEIQGWVFARYLVKFN